MSANYRRSALSGLRKVEVDKLKDDEEEGEEPGIAWEMMLVTGISLMAADVSLIIQLDLATDLHANSSSSACSRLACIPDGGSHGKSSSKRFELAINKIQILYIRPLVRRTGWRCWSSSTALVSRLASTQYRIRLTKLGRFLS
jgi:hypothetical protein